MPRLGPAPVTRRVTARRLAALLVALVAVAAACGDRDGDAVAGDPVRPTGDGATTTTTPSPGRGWIGGEPDWTAGGDGLDGLAGDARDGATEEAAAAGSAPGPATTAVPPLAGDVEVAEGPLRAGSVDDNEDFDGYLAYRARLASLGIATRDVDPTGRVVVTVTGSSGLPVAGAPVVVARDGAEIARLRTTADGTVRFLPALHGAPVDGSFEVAVVGDAGPGPAVAVEAGGAVALVADAPGGAEGPVAVDVLFLLDATGSMGDEIDRLKATIDTVAARIAGLDARPDVRFGMTLYRDEGDAFVTATYDLTADVDAFRDALAEVVADGGGDSPEALDEALAEALAVPSWRDPATTVQLVFLVADAPPQVGRQVPVPYPASILEAVGRGVKIVPIASSDTDDQAEAVFRQLAQATGARFLFLSYGAGGAALGGGTDVGPTDYEELALDELVVRLVAEEIADLTGGEVTVPPPPTTTTTNPPGQ